uniref:Uncharacterized protein n=1 Tax=Oryza meridionalis TaxID=40149 RepID=A0A0E0E4L3_9ORYZ
MRARGWAADSGVAATVERRRLRARCTGVGGGQRRRGDSWAHGHTAAWPHGDGRWAAARGGAWAGGSVVEVGAWPRGGSTIFPSASRRRSSGGGCGRGARGWAADSGVAATLGRTGTRRHGRMGTDGGRRHAGVRGRAEASSRWGLGREEEARFFPFWWSPRTERSTNNDDGVVERGSSIHASARSPLNRSRQSSKQWTAQPEHNVRSVPAAAAVVAIVVNSSAAVFRCATHVSPSELKMPSPSRSWKTACQKGGGRRRSPSTEATQLRPPEEEGWPPPLACATLPSRSPRRRACLPVFAASAAASPPYARCLCHRREESESVCV